MNILEMESQTRVLLDELEAIQADESGGDLERALIELKALARDVLKDCSGPVRLGVLGEFSAGKTRLIEAILGLAGRLPVGEIPSTGNIVEFHCKVVPGLSRSMLGKFDEASGKFEPGAVHYEVVFVTDAEAVEFLEHLRREAVSTFTSTDREYLDALNLVAPGDWDAWRQWARKVHDKGGKYHRRFLAFEAFRFAQAYQACGAGLQDKTIVVTQKTTADMAMTLPTTTTRPADGSLPEPPPVLSSVPGMLSEDQMARLFPLVRLVRVHVGLPDVLGRVLQGDGDDAFVLVDTPGLGAEESTVRDKFLCLRELREVESILIVVDSRRPGSDGALTLHDMMHDAWNASIKDRILVALARFDQLGNATSQQAAESLAAEPGPISAEELFRRQHDPLGTLVQNGRKPLVEGRNDRLAVVSAYAALWARKTTHPETLEGDDAFFAHEFTPEVIDQVERSTKLWSAVARRLRQENAADMAPADWFRSYGEDGGLSRLVHKCREHLKEHGAQNQLGKVYIKFNDLTKRYTTFRRAMEAAPIRSQTAGPAKATGFDVKDAALRLSRIYGAIISDMETVGVKPLRFVPDGRVSPVDLHGYLREECVDRVGNWNEWKLLLENVDPMRGPGQIKVFAPATGPRDDDDEDIPIIMRARRQKTVPTKSDDFFPPFRKTIEEIEALTRSVVKKALDLLLKENAARVLEDLGKHAPTVEKWARSSGLADELSAAGVNQGDLDLYGLAVKYAIDPTEYFKPLAQRCLKPPSSSDGEAIARSLFPLALTSPDGCRIGRIFPWDSEIDRKYGTNSVHGRHQIHVIRNRQAIEESAVFFSRRTVEGYRRAIGDELVKTFRQLQTYLMELSEAVSRPSRATGG